MTAPRRGRGRPRHPDVLTPAEWRTVHALRHGMSTKEIAARVGVSADAVKFHIANALAKLGLADRAQLRAWRGVPADSALNKGRSAMTTASTGPVSGEQPAPLQLGPIGQISRHVRDFDKTVAWYRDVLRLPHLYTFGDLAFFDCGGTRLFLSPAENGADAGAPSLLYFRVADIQAAFDELAARGVRFRGAPHMIHRHEDGVEEWMAFFADPEGNDLAIMSQVSPGPDSGR